MGRKSASKIDVYLEVGNRHTLAAALDWPGWCRTGRDEATALETLFEYGPRYAQILRSTRMGFQLPKGITALTIVERLKGNATTDFGVPNLLPTIDTQPLDDKELQRLQTIRKACWRAFDSAAEKSEGKTLRTGPRGGGRTVEGIVQHVLGAETAYLSSLGGKVHPSEAEQGSVERIRQAILKTLKASAHGEIPAYGPRGGKRWTPRYFVRRDAWHILDHIWEIEDRMINGQQAGK